MSVSLLFVAFSITVRRNGDFYTYLYSLCAVYMCNDDDDDDNGDDDDDDDDDDAIKIILV